MSGPPTILVIDDEPQIRRVVQHTLESKGIRVLNAATAREGADVAAAERPDLIILDIGLPDAAGESLCRELRSWTSTPILVLSARQTDADKVTLLDAGADDYVTKPFSSKELEARVRALLRRARAGAAEASVLKRDDIEVDFNKRSVTRLGTPVHLTPIEWDLLRVLAANAGRVLTHRQLFNEVWRGRSHGDAQQYLRVYVANLRRKLEADPVRPRHIHTIAGVGYRFGE